jgi:hypothetical protein
MATKQDALDSARALTTMFAHLNTIGSVLEQMSSLENEDKELRASIVKNRKEAALAKAGRDEAVEAENAVKDQCIATAKAMEFAAKEDAERIIKHANAQAIDILSGAETRLADLTTCIMQAVSDLNEKNMARDAAASDLAAIEKALAQAKSKVAKLMES